MTWSIGTLVLALSVIGIICTLYITYKAFQVHALWGVFFLFVPVLFYVGGRRVGPLIAGVVLIAAQMYFVSKHWKDVGRFFVYTMLCWAGLTVVEVRRSGWLPAQLRSDPAVVQMGTVATASEGYLPVHGGRIWYRRTGARTGTPAILLHGGPGFSSYYLKPLEALGDERPVIRYDQLGSGRSERVADTTLFTIDRFVRELDSLRSAMGYERVHLIAHSWGTILGVEYYRLHPEHVASLTLGSASLNVPEWARHARRLLGTLSDSAQRAVRTREPLMDFDAPDYVAAVNEYYDRYVWLRPVGADLDSTMRSVSQPIYAHMWGQSEFTVTGTLRTYDATRRLKTIRVPTLYTVGEFDEANPATIKRFAALTPGARFALIPDAAHVTTWDNPDATLRVVRDFLRSVDAPPVP